MNIIADLHTHSISSGHSYATISEMAEQAYKRGLKMLAITDHGPAIPGAPTELYFRCSHLVPEYIHDVKIIAGVEADILDKNGTLDISENVLKMQEFVLAGFHSYTGYSTNNIDDNTEAIINILKNKEVDAISHIGNPVYPLHYEDVIKTAKKYSKVIEINNRSFVGGSRANSDENCKKVIKLCLENKVNLIVTSDAHNQFQVGCFDFSIKLLLECGATEKDILNSDYDRLTDYLNSIHLEKRPKEKVE